MKRIIPCVLITLGMILAGIFLPVLGFVGLMLCPLPLSVLGCIEGHRNMSIAELMIEVTLFIAVSPSMAVYYLMGCAPLSAMIFMLSRQDIKEIKKFSFSGAESFLICTAASVGFKAIMLLVFWLFTGRNILFPDVAQMSRIFDQIYGDQPQLRETIRQVLIIFPHMLPSMLVIYASVETYLNYTLSRSFIKKLSPSCKNFPPELPNFNQWRFPVSLLWVSVISLIAGYFIDLETWFEGAMFIMNLQIVINILLFVHGSSFAFWIMDGFKLRKGTKIFICLILSIPFFWPWLIVMGMSDMAVNLRERIKF